MRLSHRSYKSLSKRSALKAAGKIIVHETKKNFLFPTRFCLRTMEKKVDKHLRKVLQRSVAIFNQDVIVCLLHSDQGR